MKSHQFPDPTTVTLCRLSYGPSIAVLCFCVSPQDSEVVESELALVRKVFESCDSRLVATTREWLGLGSIKSNPGL